ncbi:MAG: transcription termination factor NusA [Thermomicrobiales bacterium]|nr:transcription termination factor NusA [Thermomicrobiales bacterium]
MKSDFYTAIAQIAAERGIPKEAVISSVEHALKTVYKKEAGLQDEENVTVNIDPQTGGARIFVHREVVDEVEDPDSQLTLAEARKEKPNAKIGEVLMLERTPKNFGRIAAQTAKQVVLQKIRDFEREMVYSEYQDRVGEVLNGIVQRADEKAVIVELGKSEAVMPAREKVPSERYRPGQRLKVYLLDASKEQRGPQLIVSRAHPGLLKRLFELEVPEIFSGVVEIMAIAREPGTRSKVAVVARQENVDPVGSCVGIRGVRIQNIVNELQGEKIDVIEWSPDQASFVANALSPAKVLNVTLTEDGDNKTARVLVPSDQMSLAIGKEGQNARLAHKLTGWRIDVKDPESLLGQSGDLLRQAQEEAETSMPSAFDTLKEQGRQPRLVNRKTLMITISGHEFGPLPANLAGYSADVELDGDIVNVYYNRDLQARFTLDNEPLPLHDDVLTTD